MPVMSGAQALVRSLARHGVEVVFGLPGVQIMDVFDALYDEPGIRMVLTRHEQATTYMADGYARTTGKPGVALVVRALGPSTQRRDSAPPMPHHPRFCWCRGR